MYASKTHDQHREINPRLCCLEKTHQARYYLAPGRGCYALNRMSAKRSHFGDMCTRQLTPLGLYTEENPYPASEYLEQLHDKDAAF
jgi:hypothetical protein